MPLRNMTSHSPEGTDCLLSDPKETPPKFGTHAPLPKDPFPYHCQKRQMAIYGAYFHTKPIHAGLTQYPKNQLLLFSFFHPALSPNSCYQDTCPSLSHPFIPYHMFSKLPSGAFSPPLRSCPCLCPCRFPSVAGTFCLSPAVSLCLPGTL